MLKCPVLGTSFRGSSLALIPPLAAIDHRSPVMLQRRRYAGQHKCRACQAWLSELEPFRRAFVTVHKREAAPDGFV